MVVVKIELWKGGDPKQVTILGCVVISNDGSGSPTSGNYEVRLLKKPGRSGRMDIWKTGVIKEFKRKALGGYDLLYQALQATVGDRTDRPAIRSIQKPAMRLKTGSKTR